MPVPVPVVGDAEVDGVVVALAELGQQLGVQGRVALGQGFLDGMVGFAEDLDDVGGPGLQGAGAEFGDRAAAADDVLAALLDPGQLRQQVLVGAVAVADQEAGEERQEGGDRVVLRESERPSQVSPRAGCG